MVRCHNVTPSALAWPKINILNLPRKHFVGTCSNFVSKNRLLKKFPTSVTANVLTRQLHLYRDTELGRIAIQ
jgi:hypothetical protein